MGAVLKFPEAIKAPAPDVNETLVGVVYAPEQLPPFYWTGGDEGELVYDMELIERDLRAGKTVTGARLG